MSKRKTHLSDIRYHNNGGVNRASCNVQDTERLYLFGEVINGRQVCTCKKCPAAYAKRYPWTRRKS